MANIIDIRRRIRSVKNTRQITKAMKMVSAARLRRAQERALAARPYAQMLTAVLKSLTERAEVYSPETGEPRSPLLLRREEKNILLIVVTGDRGLAGAFNANIVKAAAKFMLTKGDKNIDLETLGRKGRDYFRRRYIVVKDERAGQRSGPIQITGEQAGIMNRIAFSHAAELSADVVERYSREEIDSAYILFNEFKSVIAQRVVVEKILPMAEIGEHDILQAEEPTTEARRRAAEAAASAGVSLRQPETGEMDKQAAGFATRNVDYIYEQPPEELFAGLLPKYIAIQIYRALMESVAAEHAARMTAMDSATNNASDMIDSLTLIMNRVRQAKITKEIIEIVSGAAAS